MYMLVREQQKGCNFILLNETIIIYATCSCLSIAQDIDLFNQKKLKYLNNIVYNKHALFA